MNTNSRRMGELDKVADELRGEKLGVFNQDYLLL